MDISLPNATKANVGMGMSFQALFLGADAYGNVRSGDDVTLKCADGDVVGKAQSVQIGPMGQFLGMGLTHAAQVGRVGADVRVVIDDLEARYVTTKTDTKKALDPRTLYTCLIVATPYVPPAPALSPVA